VGAKAGDELADSGSQHQNGRGRKLTSGDRFDHMLEGVDAPQAISRARTRAQLEHPSALRALRAADTGEIPEYTDHAAPVSSSASLAIEIHSLTKQFGSITAVDDLSLEVKRGEVFAFVGPNGAGKSTVIKILCTLMRATSGSAQIAGFDVAKQPDAVRQHIGLVFQETTLDQQLTAEENLRFHAVMYRVPRAERNARIGRALRAVQLADRANDLVSTFSGGMARRLEVARAMLHTPSVLFLDEPTLGLDPQTRALMWQDVLQLREQEGITIFLTTHYMEEAEIADRLAIIDYGRLVAVDTPARMKAALAEDTVELRTDDDELSVRRLRASGFTADEDDGVVRITVRDGESQVARLVQTVGGGVTYVHVHQPSLDDVFLHHTGRLIRDEPSSPMTMRKLNVGGHYR
jgi:ABC-2 type transport system ATP-binding protein